MLIGIPKEIKNHEYRVSVSPQGVKELVHNGHQVMVQKGAGHALGFEESHYQEAGALLMDSMEDVYERAELIVKVKEPQIEECQLLKEGQIIFSYLHLAAEPKITNALLSSGCIGIAYETVTSDAGQLPLLIPMSEIAGKVAAQASARCLENVQGGRGVLLSGVPGVPRGNVVVIGGGTAGENAARISAQIGANVVILEKSVERIRHLEKHLPNNISCIYSTKDVLEEYVVNADVVIAAVLTPGGAAPKVVSEDLVKRMKRGAVIADISIDQGGCVETSKPTTHDKPTYIIHDVVHYCVTNIPGAVSRTATMALENTTLPYILALANKGYRAALRDDENFRNGLNIYRGRITHEEVAKSLGHAYVPPTTFLG